METGRAEKASIPGEPHNSRRQTMRVMVIVKATKNSEAGEMPDEALIAAMGQYNEEL
jgi:hypothetical protein